jgi:hypothetical protein
MGCVSEVEVGDMIRYGMEEEEEQVFFSRVGLFIALSISTNCLVSSGI